MSYIQKIKTNIPNSDRFVDIDLQGKSLILTGGNGCGKTQLINHIHECLTDRIVNRNNSSKEKLEQLISTQIHTLKGFSPADSQYQNHLSTLRNWEQKLEAINNFPVLINDLEKLVISYNKQSSVFSMFEAMRKAEIRPTKGSMSKDELVNQFKTSKASTVTLFEECLLSNKTMQAYAESEKIDNDPMKAELINNWFIKLENDLRELFEDPKLTLRFNSTEQNFYLVQENKEPYRFQNLSSGFSSILSIYADLITQIELTSTKPEEIDGIVFIDEIDAHLHVSLQRKIFSFLVRAFPNVQFIVTTHSPFVVSSVNDAVIYDLSRLEQVEDLSMYSYEAVLEGLFGVLPISEVLKNKIIEIGQIIKAEHPNIERLELLIKELSDHENKLDNESLYFLQKAKVLINKQKSEL